MLLDSRLYLVIRCHDIIASKLTVLGHGIQERNFLVMHWSFNAKRTVPDLVSTLRKQTDGDAELIAEIVYLMGAELPVGSLREIFSILNVPGEYQSRISGKEREQVRRDSKKYI